MIKQKIIMGVIFTLLLIASSVGFIFFYKMNEAETVSVNKEIVKPDSIPFRKNVFDSLLFAYKGPSTLLIDSSKSNIYMFTLTDAVKEQLDDFNFTNWDNSFTLDSSKAPYFKVDDKNRRILVTVSRKANTGWLDVPTDVLYPLLKNQE